MWPFWSRGCYKAWRNLEFQNVTLSFNKIMIPSTPLGEPKGGLKSRGSIFWIGLHSLQILTPLNILNYLKRCLSAYVSAPTGVHQLWERVVEQWGKIDEEQCQKWIESMPRRIEAVINAKGGHTKY